MQKQLAFLGLGVMGTPLAINLARQGYPLKVWNRTANKPSIAAVEAAGGQFQATLREAVAEAEVIFTCLGDVPDGEEVLLGAEGVISYARAHSLIIDFSTIGRTAAQRWAQTLSEKCLRFLDAPVSGGDVGAWQGTLTIMVGGEEADLQAAKPYLESLGKNIVHCGPVGSGQAVKLCNQVLVALNMVGLCEAIALAQQQGIEPALMLEVCATGAAGSWALTHLGPKIVAADLEPGFMVRHLLKDLRLVQESLTKDLPGVSLAQQQFQQLSQLPQGDRQGTQALIRCYGSLE